jgi:prepilin-type N-terminal cleavage/methylation domain-containing protein
MSRIKGIPHTDCRRGSGFSLLELVIVIAIISTLLVFAIKHLWPWQAEAERVAMESVVGSLRSALGIKVASYFVQNDVAGVRTLTDTNPMDRLSEVPGNYLGALSGVNPAHIAGGSWYFDVSDRVLVYRVRNQDYFRGGLGEPARARFIIRVVYEERGRDGGKEVAGVTLDALEPYTWIRKD